MPGATEQEGVCKAGNLFLLGLRLKFPWVHSVFVNLKHTSAGKAGNPFQTTQGNRLSCRDQEGRRGSAQAPPRTTAHIP